jgi:hypothetical protein
MRQALRGAGAVLRSTAMKMARHARRVMGVRQDFDRGRAAGSDAMNALRQT